jgi:hypothetical protein
MQSHVEISGYGYNKRLCQDVVCWFLNEYLPRYKIQLEILHRGLNREKVYGFCDCISNKPNPRKFLIELNTHMKREEYIRTLLHELVHLMQFTKGDLRFKKGKLFYKNVSINEYGYWKQPHEVEAHEWEEKLYYQYQQYILNRKILPFHSKQTLK